MTLTDDEGRRVAHAHLERRLAAAEALNARLLTDAAPRFGSLAAAQVYYGLTPQPGQIATGVPAGRSGGGERHPSYTRVISGAQNATSATKEDR